MINVNAHVGGPEKPVVAYHTVEKERSHKTSGGLSMVVREGNFSHSSKQMEHAILIELLEQVTPLLEEHDMMLDVTVDGDLDTNKTLASIPIVHQIYADLKHITQNIRKSLGKYIFIFENQNNNIETLNYISANKKYKRWQTYEQQIMRHYRGCMITAGLRKEDPDLPTPLETELREAQLQGLIHHLTGDHSLCWPEVCWHKNNPDLVLQEPHLMNASDSEQKAFEDMLGSIFRLPQGQGLVTMTRTSCSEAFNRRKLVFLDKRIDYWRTYMARHACTIMLQNLGLVEMMKVIRLQCTAKGFSETDMQNLEKIDKHVRGKQLSNRLKLKERNQALHAKYAEAQEELAGVDFSSVCIYIINYNKNHILTSFYFSGSCVLQRAWQGSNQTKSVCTKLSPSNPEF